MHNTRDDAFWASLKAIAELAHAADFLLRSPRPELRELGRWWLDHAWLELAEGEVIRAAIAADPQFLPVALAAVPFHLAGHSNEKLVDVCVQQLPQLVMDPIAWTFVVPALELLGIAVDVEHAERARARSVLDRRLDATMALDDIYFLVHECLYVSRWGHVAPRYDAPTRAYVAAILPALIERHRASGDADLIAELILASRTSRLVPSDAAYEVVQGAQSPDGSIVAIERPDAGRRPTHPTLSRTYHTTLAAIMALSS